MMVLRPPPPARSGVPVAAATVGLAGVALLLARPWLAARADDPTMLLIVLFVSLGAVGAWWAVPAGAPAAVPGARAAWLVTVAGVMTFAVGRAVAGGRGAVPLAITWVVLNTLAAVAEEAFFRRLLYGLLAPHGAVLAVAGSAGLFAVVHVTVWGLWALPLDFAAGLVLSWQRWATGRWTVPAATHVAANLLAMA